MRFGSVTTSNPAAECQFALTLKIPPTFRKLLLLGCLNSLSLPFFHPRPSERLVFGTWTCGVGDSCRERLTAIGAIVQYMAPYDMADRDIYEILSPDRTRIASVAESCGAASPRLLDSQGRRTNERRPYRLTSRGRRNLQLEVDRMWHLTKLADLR